MSTISTDSRVPTFIQYDGNTKNEKKQKRKRAAPAEGKKVKAKRSKKDQAPVATDNSVNVWVGVHVENELGAFSVYFGENDDRNSTEVFQIEDVLQDDDYASVLGALKALEVSQGVEAPINVYTSYRGLSRVTSGKRGSVVFPDLVEKIKTLIAGKKEGVTMQYVSGRTASPEHSASVERAIAAIKNKIDGATTETEKNPVTQEASSQELALEDMVVETTQQESIKESVSVNESIVEQVAVKSQQDTPLDEEKVNGVQQTIETADEGNAADIVKNDTVAEAPMEDADVATITKVTTVVEEITTVEMVEQPVDQVMRDASSTSLSEMDEDASKLHSEREISNDDLIQDQEEEPSSWSLGIRKAWDMLTSPFKSRS